VLDDNMRQTMIGMTPMRRLGRVEDIAAAVLYLASDAGSFLTGKVIEVDGGLTVPNLPLGLPDLGS
jgi:7-alpha-hydroxysteroid dehydrogenase